MRIDGFDWDFGNLVKCQKHGVNKAEIEAFLLSSPRFAPDVGHSACEVRLVAVGRNSAGRAMFVGFTVRVKDGLVPLRPISARYMHAKEARRYDTQDVAQSPSDEDG